ncbi:formate/nitrite transporter family protein [Cohnella thermotolerans]|uniref:formate/nitrite transporter family protein n=1 Tax=Cohnella thermotolerans TaxID=329858 RepID=UPI0004069048|nr:formate/nitrite transporter family protein [Cohnella thermotolerans]
MIEKALSKKSRMDASLLRYLLSSSLAGAYVGMGVVLMLSVSAPLYAVHSPVTPLVMGLSFGIALLLVVFAGAELFTGNNLTFAVSALARRTSWTDAARLKRSAAGSGRRI